MAGIRGKSSPPANQNAFKHGLVGITRRRANGALNPDEQSIRQEILAGLLTDTGGETRISTAMRVLAEIIASDVSLLVIQSAVLSRTRVVARDRIELPTRGFSVPRWYRNYVSPSCTM